MIDKAIFYKEIRPLFGMLKPSQVKGMDIKLDYYDDNQVLISLPQFAYILATIYHETGGRMRPINEILKGVGKPYGVKINGRIYYGRGDVQITWLDNYKRVGTFINQNLVENPELALVPSISVEIAVKGMVLGWFTGKKLSDYINDKKTDFLNARRIINRMDKADLIAGYADKFLKALEKAKTD